MKTAIVLTIIISLLSFESFSQPSWAKVLSEKGNKSTAIDNALLSDSVILQTGYIGHAGYYSFGDLSKDIVAYDLKGKLLWHVAGNYENSLMGVNYENEVAKENSQSNSQKSPQYYGGLFKKITTNENSIYAAGYHDLFYENQSFLTISKFDNHGNMIFVNTHPWETIIYRSPVTAIDVYEEDKILIGLG